MRYVAYEKHRKPFWGNLALALALITVNVIRVSAFVTYALLSKKGSPLLKGRRP